MGISSLLLNGTFLFSNPMLSKLYFLLRLFCVPSVNTAKAVNTPIASVHLFASTKPLKPLVNRKTAIAVNAKIARDLLFLPDIL